MRKIRDFRCVACHETQELLVEDPVVRAFCSSCGGESFRIISPVRCQLNGADDGFPGAHMKWVREHESAGAKST